MATSTESKTESKTEVLTEVPTVTDIKSILEKLTPESLAALPDDIILQLRKEMNPYGRTIEGSNGVLLFSYTDLRASYLKKLITTSMIGFLNRACDEWLVPDDEKVIPVYDYVKDPSILSDPSILTEEEQAKLAPDDLKSYKLKESYRQETMKKIQLQHELMKKRIIVKEFLEYMFQFDPDQHVRSTYVPNISDPERQLLDTPAAKLAIDHKAKKDKLFKEDAKTIKELIQMTSGKSVQNRTEKPVRAIIKQSRILKNPKEKDATLPQNTTEMIPPNDLYHRLTNYMEVNYEELRDVVNNLYCEKPDLETAINPYVFYTNETAKAAGFKDASDAADKFIDKHKNEVITSIYTADSGKWNLFGPFKQVRDRIKFYNEKTQVLEAIMSRIEEDAHLGSELMKKRVIRKKKENIQSCGPDDPAFTKWKAQNSALRQMGAETLKEEDLDEPTMEEVEVPVFRLSDGGRTLEKTKFFVEADAPVAIQAGNSVIVKKEN